MRLRAAWMVQVLVGSKRDGAEAVRGEIVYEAHLGDGYAELVLDCTSVDDPVLAVREVHLAISAPTCMSADMMRAQQRHWHTPADE